MLWSNNFRSNKQILCGPPESLQRSVTSGPRGAQDVARCDSFWRTVVGSRGGQNQIPGSLKSGADDAERSEK